MRAAIAALILLAACHHEVKTSLDFDATGAETSVLTTEKEVAKTKTEAPTQVDIKTAHSDLGVIVARPDGTGRVARVSPGHPLDLEKGDKVVGTVPLETTTSDKNEHIGAKTATENATAKTAEVDNKTNSLKGKLATDETWDFLGWKFYLSCILALIVLLGSGYAYLKFIRKVAWL